MSNSREAPSRRLLVTAGTTLIVIGSGHFLTLVALRWTVVAGWFGDGFWGAVPFISRTPSIETLASSAAFWSSVGGFAVPTALIGALIIHLVRQCVAVPVWMGWAIGVWGPCAAALLNAPTPFFLLPLVGALIIIIARRVSAAPGGGR